MGRKILFVTTDQQRYDTLGCNGGTLARTPVIDALAAAGVRYARAVPQSVVCMPSRSTMITGQHPSTHGVWMNGVPLPTDAPSVAADLLRHGYRTALVGKAHFEPFMDPFGRFTENNVARSGEETLASRWSDGSLGPHRGFEHLAALRPRLGKSHVVHCVDAYQYEQGLQHLPRSGSISTSLGGFVRRQAMLPVISDFLFDDVDDVIRELALLAITHDVFLVLIDSAFAFTLPKVPAGWIEISDVETGRTRTVSRRQYAQLADRARDWQQRVLRDAKDADLDAVVIGLDEAASNLALSEFVVERRLRKTHA